MRTKAVKPTATRPTIAPREKVSSVAWRISAAAGGGAEAPDPLFLRQRQRQRRPDRRHQADAERVVVHAAEADVGDLVVAVVVAQVHLEADVGLRQDHHPDDAASMLSRIEQRDADEERRDDLQQLDDPVEGDVRVAGQRCRHRRPAQEREHQRDDEPAAADALLAEAGQRPADQHRDADHEAEIAHVAGEGPEVLRPQHREQHVDVKPDDRLAQRSEYAQRRERVDEK